MQILRYLLFPFAWLYGGAMAFRNLCYNLGIYPSKKMDKALIVVGNLSMGGTGKSPHIEYLIRKFSGKYPLATLSRGYGRKSKGFLLADANSTVADVGDEPLQFKKKFPKIPVAVNGNRVQGVEKIVQSHPETKVILLDDAFQHRKLKAGLNILLTDYSRPFWKDHVFPMGYLREWKTGKKRAQIIIVTKCPKTLSSEEQKKIVERIRPGSDQKVYFSYLKYSSLLGLNTNKELKFSADQSVLLVTGIANPAPLYGYLKKNFRKVDHVAFDDHHEFSESDAASIKAAFLRLQGASKVIITTEKDAMRMTAPDFNNLPVYYLPMEISILEREQEFLLQIEQYIQSFKS